MLRTGSIARGVLICRGIVPALLSVSVGALLGCTGIIPGLMPHDVRYDAARLEHDQCDATPVDPRLYGPGLVQKVEPYYHFVMGGPNGGEARLAGARLELRPLPGVTEELLERGLECRSAQVMLGQAEPATNEPYAFTDGWVRIDVKPGRGAFVVTLTAEDSTRAREVLARAHAFAGPRTSTVDRAP
jgi:hypothetical protein